MSKRTTARSAAKPAAPEVLNGSNTLPALIEVAEGKSLQLGAVVVVAHQASGLTVDAWNALPEAERDEHLNKTIENIKAAVAAGAEPDQVIEKIAEAAASAGEAAAASKDTDFVTVEPLLIVSAPGGPRRRAGFAFGPEPVDLSYDQLGETDEERKAVLDTLRADPKLKLDSRMIEVSDDD
jgi:hypothetical protein